MCWIPVLHTVRLFRLLKPVLIRPCSSRLSNLILEDTFAKILAPITDDNRKISDDFFAGASPTDWRDLKQLIEPSYLNIEWTSSQSEKWIEIVGNLCIVPFGSAWALCLPDFDGGILKYDTRLAPVIANIKKLIAIKGVIAEITIMDFIDSHCDPGGSLDTLVTLKAQTQSRYEAQGLTSEMHRVKVMYREMCSTVSSARQTLRWDKQITLEIEGGIYEDVCSLDSHYTELR